MSVVKVLDLHTQLRTKRSPRPRDVRKLLELATTVSQWPTSKENKALVLKALRWAKRRST